MSQFRTIPRGRRFEAGALLIMLLTAIWFAAVVVYAEARRHGFF